MKNIVLERTINPGQRLIYWTIFEPLVIHAYVVQVSPNSPNEWTDQPIKSDRHENDQTFFHDFPFSVSKSA